MNEKLIKFTLPSFDQKELPIQASSKTRILVAEDDPVSRTLILEPGVMASQETLADRFQVLETSLSATGSLKLRIPL